MAAEVKEEIALRHVRIRFWRTGLDMFKTSVNFRVVRSFRWGEELVLDGIQPDPARHRSCSSFHRSPERANCLAR